LLIRIATRQIGGYNLKLVKNTNPFGQSPLPGNESAAQEALGRADVFLDFQQQLARVAKVQRPVLLIGERGTGKELAAARVHFLSPRWGGPLIKLNCAALSPSVLESELFGHEAGAFTGAARRRLGRFEAANGGTLFLDEIGQMPMPVQEKILRVVEYGSFERVGASEPVNVDVRIVGATNANLPALAAAGQFKDDLLDRLSFEVLFVPTMRERGAADIDLLAQHFAARMAAELGLARTPVFSAAAQAALRSYPWPGNVRELKNVVERAVSRAEGASIQEVVFDPFRGRMGGETASPALRPAKPGGEAGPSGAGAAAGPAPELPVNLPEVITRIEQRYLRQALAQARFRQREAATLLGLTYDQFRGLYRKSQNNETDGAPEPNAP
jgi:psp operon transcriptional activator